MSDVQLQHVERDSDVASRWYAQFARPGWLPLEDSPIEAAPSSFEAVIPRHTFRACGRRDHRAAALGRRRGHLDNTDSDGSLRVSGGGTIHPVADRYRLYIASQLGGRMTPRNAHLVGSLPGEDPVRAMTTAVGILGPYLQTLPDGETGERRNWVISIVDELRNHPDLRLKKTGDWSDYDRTPVLAIKRGHQLYGASLDFGHVAAVTDSYPSFEHVRESAGLGQLRFQQGVPGDFDLAVFTLGPVGALLHRRAFTEASLGEIRDVKKITGPDTLFQIEVPVELVLLAKAPAAARPALARFLARAVTAMAAGAAEGTRFAVHLCLGDMNNKAFGTMTDVSPLVLLANAVMRTWPAGRPLEVLHAPFAAADHPATTEVAFYRPLRSLTLAPGAGFAAGFAHESQSLADQRRIRTIIEDQLERQVLIASACGLGRRSPAAGRAVLERTAELCLD